MALQVIHELVLPGCSVVLGFCGSECSCHTSGRSLLNLQAIPRTRKASHDFQSCSWLEVNCSACIAAQEFSSKITQQDTRNNLSGQIRSIKGEGQHELGLHGMLLLTQTRRELKTSKPV